MFYWVQSELFSTNVLYSPSLCPHILNSLQQTHICNFHHHSSICPHLLPQFSAFRKCSSLTFPKWSQKIKCFLKLVPWQSWCCHIWSNHLCVCWGNSLPSSQKAPHTPCVPQPTWSPETIPDHHQQHSKEARGDSGPSCQMHLMSPHSPTWLSRGDNLQ